jgi:hypothetical protein
VKQRDNEGCLGRATRGGEKGGAANGGGGERESSARNWTREKTTGTSMVSVLSDSSRNITNIAT